MKSHSIRFLRIVLAVLCLFAFVVLFADFSGPAAEWLAPLAKVQVVPALLAVNVLAVALLIVLTLVFGRLYCSVLCPFGILQDFFAWVRRVFGKKQKRRLGFYHFNAERKGWRYGFLGLFILLAVAAFCSLIPMSLAGILDPYSAFGRIASQSVVPAWRAVAGSVADTMADKGEYLFESVPSAFGTFSVAVLVIAVISLAVIAVFAWREGRGYCNTVCPVGTLLGLLSRFSFLKPVIDTEKCNRCGSCGRHCKASCIDTKNHKIDYSRCVVCFDCINNCSQGAISYRRVPRKTEVQKTGETADSGRRAFLLGTAFMAGASAAAAADKLTDGGLAPLKAKKRREGVAVTVPPGAFSLRHFRSHCTACQLCVSHCPDKVLRPGRSLDGFMQPVMVFTEGFCRPECTSCGDVCPTGAISALDKGEKAFTKIGTAHVDADICISAAFGQTCGNCGRHCPAEAISMVKGENGNLRPVVDESRCIGCGSCEYHCPSGTAGQLSADHAAIFVEGIDVHRKINR